MYKRHGSIPAVESMEMWTVGAVDSILAVETCRIVDSIPAVRHAELWIVGLLGCGLLDCTELWTNSS